MRALLAALVVATVASCGGEAPVAPSVACELEIAELEPWMQQVVADGVPDVATDAWIYRVGFAPSDDDGSTDVPIGTDPREIAMIAADLERHDEPVSLQIADDAAWLQVAGVIDAVRRAGRARVGIVVPADTRATAPPPTVFSDTLAGMDIELEAPDAAGRSTDLILSQLLGECPRALERSRANPSMDTVARLRVWASEMPAALRSCQCRADVPGLRSFFWAAHRRHERTPTREVTIELSANDGSEVRLDPRARFADVALPALRAARGPIRPRLLVTADATEALRDTGAWIGEPLDHRPPTMAATFKPETLDPEVDAAERAAIQRTIRQQRRRIQSCYERQLLIQPDLAGTVTTTFSISIDGRVRTASATGVHPKVASCVAAVIRHLHFPKRSMIANVRYPFTFRSM